MFTSMLAGAVELKRQIGSDVDGADVSARINKVGPTQDPPEAARDEDEIGPDVDMIIGHL